MDGYFGAQAQGKFWPYFISNGLGVGLIISIAFISDSTTKVLCVVLGVLILGYNIITNRNTMQFAVKNNILTTFTNKRINFSRYHLKYVTAVRPSKTYKTIAGLSESVRLEFGERVIIVQNAFYKNWNELKMYLLNLPLYSGEVPENAIEYIYGMPNNEKLKEMGVWYEQKKDTGPNSY